MTVTAQTPMTGKLLGDSSTVAFAFGFRIDTEAELVVVLADSDGVETIQTLTTEYTVAGVGSPTGGTVTFVTAPATGETVVIYRAVPLAQTTDLANRKAVVPEVMEDTYDDIVRMVQDLNSRVRRAVLGKVTGAVQDLVFPEPDANALLGWNAAGTALETKIGTAPGVISSSSDNAVPRWDGTSGNQLQNSTLFALDTGRVGVRDAAPNRTFEVAGIGTEQIVAAFLSGSTVRGRLSISDANTTDDSEVGIAARGDLLELVAGAAIVATLDGDNGRVGIGSTAPEEALHIEASGATIKLVDTALSRTATMEIVSNDLTLTMSGDDDFVVTSRTATTPSEILRVSRTGDNMTFASGDISFRSAFGAIMENSEGIVLWGGDSVINNVTYLRQGKASSASQFLVKDDRFGFQTAGANEASLITGTGSPEGVVTAGIGSVFMRVNGGAGTSFYVKESGTGNTGWVGK